LQKSSKLSVRILSSATHLPPHYYSQAELLDGLEQLWSRQHYNPQRLRQLHQAMQIQGRHLSLPRHEYLQASDFSLRNQAYTRLAPEMGEAVVGELLRSSNLQAQELDYLVFTSVTGIAVPSPDAMLMNRLPFRSDLKRLPLFGLGCLGGAAGIARLSDLLRGQPGSKGILLSVELCSLTLQPQDLSVANLVASGLFGDGAAAVLLESVPDTPEPVEDGLQASYGPPKGSPRGLPSGPEILDTRSVFFPNSQEVMGWEVGSHGFSIVLSPQVPYYAEHHLGPALLEFLAHHQLTPSDISAWVAHPGGPKVVDVLQQSLGLKAEALAVTRGSLQEVGNLSSASVLFVLHHFLQNPPPPGSYGLMLAMGPAFCAELVLLRW